MRKSVCRFVPVLILLITLALPASAAVYDFSGLGAASGGFKPQGNRFLVSDLFANDGTSMYYDDGGANQTVNGMIIKPDGTNLSSFDLDNLTISPYSGTYTVSITVHADLKAGGTTSQSVPNYGLTAATSLTTMGMNFGAFNDVTELRIDLSVAGDKVWNINFNNITITDEQAPVVPGAEPTTQATDLTAASTGTSVINIYWQNGNGARRVVFAKQGDTGVPTVTDGTVYTANADFSAAADIGGGWKCVYRDTGRVLSMSGLSANTEYRMVVYEFNGIGGGENYLTTTASNIINHTTSPAGLDKKDFNSLGTASGGFKPQGGRYLVSETFTNDGTSMYYNDSGASVSGMVIKPNATTLFSFDLVDLELIPYDADRTVTVTVTADLKAGGTTSQTVNNFTMYLGIPYSLSLMGMDFSAFNDVTELRFDITTDQVYNINFGNITISDPDEFVVGTEPTTQASDLKVASTSMTTLDVYWVNGNGTSRVVFVKAGNAGTPTVTDGTEYTADANFGTAADVGGGWKCVFRGTENHLRIAGLSAGTEYRTVVYEFDGSGGGENYLTTVATNIINHTTDPAGLPKYDFSALGAPAGGFKPQGNRFLVSETFTNDITNMYYNSSIATETGIVIKPDGTNLSMFDLADMEFSPYAADRIVSITITADLNAGGTTSQSISGFTMYNGLAYSLALLGLDFSAFVDVTELRFDITLTGGSVVNQLNFDNITLGGYKVAYDGNGNTGGAVPVDATSYETGDTATVLGNTGSLSRTGYTFAGWNTAANGSGTSYNGGDTFAMGSSNVTLYAQWTAIDYTVTYDGNTNTGGSVPVDGNTYNITNTVTVRGNTGSLTKTGYNFSGWNTAANGSGTSYNGGDTFAMGSSNVTLYAQWTAIPYSVTYNGNNNTGGAVPTDGTIYHYGDTVTVQGNTGSLSRIGYTFAGWNTAANGSGTSYSGGDTFGVTGDITLYAQWTAIDYTVTYNGNTNTGGSVPVDGNTYNITNTVTVRGNTGSLTKTGYNFSGWNTAANGSGTSYNGGDTFAMGSSNVTLYAQWTAIPYSVTYSGNGHTGGLVPVDGNTYYITNTVTVRDNTGSLVKTGHTFNGWNTAADGSGTGYNGGDTFALGAGDVTLYAQWTINNYVLTVNSGVGGGIYPFEDVVTIAADPPAAGLVFDQWIGDTGAVANAYQPNTTVTIPDGDVIVTAAYKDPGTTAYSLTVVNGSGSGDYLPGETVPLAADAPAAGLVFDQWTGDTATIANINLPETTLIMPGAITTVTATFKAQGAVTYPLTVTSGSGGGDYLPGETVALAADAPLVGLVFDQWTGDTTTIANINLPDTTLVMPAAAAAVTAEYKAQGAVTYSLTVTNGTGGGDYLPGANVAISATVPVGHTFSHWSGQTAWVADTGQADTTLTMPAADISVNAVAPINTYALTYEAGTGGSIAGTTPQTVDYGADGSGVSAVPQNGYSFMRWSDGVATAFRSDVNITADLTVTAFFTRNSYTLAYTAGDNGSISGPGLQQVIHGGDGSEVLAVPDPGYAFAQWDDGSLENPRLDTGVIGNISVTAVFEAVVSNTFTLAYTAGANGAIIGQTYQTVSRGGNGSDVTARPESGYRFVRWSDGVTTATRRDVNVTGDIAVTAEFTAIWTPGGELPDDLDLDGNGTPDQDQGNIAVVSNGSGLYFGAVLPDDIVLEYLEWIDAATVADTDNRPDVFPLGLVSFRVLTAFVGDTLELKIYCSQPIPQGTIWYKHDSSNGWYDFSAQVVISDDRLSVTLTLRDGGIGDADGIENGIIEDPSGPALFNGHDDNGSHGGGDGGCFLRSLGRTEFPGDL